MTSSGTFSFYPSNGELLLAAFSRIGIHPAAITQDHMINARRELNFLFSEWSNKQVNLWEVIRTQVTLVDGSATYAVNAKTVMILDASIVLNFNTTTETRRFITPISRTQYLSFSNQLIKGPPTVYWFDRLIAPTITLWPVPDGGGPYTLDYFSCTQMQDANLSGGETPDLPYRWFDAVVAGLSHRLARIYAPSMEAVRKADAVEAWMTAAAQDTENVSLSLTPQLSGYYRR